VVAPEVGLYWPARRHSRPTGSDITSKKVARPSGGLATEKVAVLLTCPGTK